VTSDEATVPRRGGRSKSSKRGPAKTSPQLERIEVSIDAALELAERAKHTPLGEEGGELLADTIRTLDTMQRMLVDNNVTLAELRALVFGPRDERSSKVLPAKAEPVLVSAPAPDGEPGGEPSKPKRRRPGHGRRSADEYTGASTRHVAHDSLKAGCRCPACLEGTLYSYAPKRFIHFTSSAPIEAQCTIVEQFRCGSCQLIFSATHPEGATNALKKTADPSVTVMLAFLRYVYGMPFWRIADLQDLFGIPLPWATQWDLVNAGAKVLRRVFDALVELAARGQLIHVDDTRQMVLDVVGKARRAAEEEKRRTGKAKSSQRTGSFTTGMVVEVEGQKILLFFTGPKHAGENLEGLLRERPDDLARAILMSDGLSWNTSGDIDVIDARCNAHARRKFVAQIKNFPDECRIVLETFQKIYATDARARAEGLTAEERLESHKAESKPALDALWAWMEEQRESKQVEPNSGLGKALEYVRSLWKQLTCFTEVAGVPLDNNICERALKLAIRHRRNSMFYKTMRGAEVGDIYMTLFHTAQAAGVNPKDYVLTLLANDERAQADPTAWLPSNFSATLGAIGSNAVESPVAVAS